MKATPLSNRLSRFFLVAEIIFLFVPGLCHAAQASRNPPAEGEKDILLFTNGEKLIGRLQRSTGDSVVFHSDMAGDITVTWSKIKELRSSQRFAVVEKGVRLRTDESDAKIPQGTISMTDGHVRVDTAPEAAPVTLPLSNTADVIDEATFARVVLHRPAWYKNWKGSATVGLSIVNATQQSQNYTSSVNFIRDVPGENWMSPESRTILTFNSAYGELSQPDTPTLKTSIFHARGERDRYISPRLYLFAGAQFDHDYSQGLDLQQTYGGGLGWSTIKSDNEQLDLRAALAYESQRFFLSSQDQHLVSSVFSEAYSRKFPNKITLHQDFSITPSWSNSSALSATGDLLLTIPIIKRISFTVGTADTFLNNPSPGFRKNSFQFTSGITYSVP